MPAAITDKFADTYNAANPNVARVTSTRSAAGTSLSCDNLSGWPTGTVVHFSTYRLNTSNAVVAGTQIDWVGIVSGSTIGSLTRITGATDNGSAVGDVVEMNPTAKWASNLVNGILVGHNQDGTHATNSITTANITDSNVTTAKLANGAVTNAKLDSDLAAGWVGITGSISAVTYNGNRSYSLTTSSDNSAVISPGMRLRTTRTVSAPTQCASLNGTNNYFSKTSPAGMAQTDNITVMAWIKLTAYSASVQTIMSRANGTTDGWSFNIATTGQVILGGVRVTDDYIQSYQSVPLNKWVHVAASISSTGATGQVYFDGVAVPTSFANNANTAFAAPTADFRIGAGTGGTLLFGGKIAQPAVFSAVIAAATIRTYISQGLSGSETSLISAYSFNNSITDLNTSNANNLTNNNSTSITNADSPFGGQADGTISATKDYAIVQTTSASTLVVQVPEGCTIPTNGGISACSYSSFKNPYGFPGQKGKWQLRSSIRTSNNQPSAVTSTWYNIASAQLTVPIGEWVVGYSAYALISATSGNNVISTTLSTASNAESDVELSATMDAQSSTQIGGCMNPSPKGYSQTTQNPLYLNTATLATAGSATLYNIGNQQATIIYADNAYV